MTPEEKALRDCGTRRGYRRHLERDEAACPECRDANATYGTTLRRRRLPVGDRRHGSMNAYLNWGCRCEPCRATAARVRAEKKLAKPPAPWPTRIDLPGEEWRPVSGWEGMYEVSNLGRVYSIRLPGRARSGRLRAAHPRKSGHLSLGLSVDGYREQVDVHCLVMRAFAGPCPEGMEVRHLDGNPANNALANLRYGTRSENVHDAIRHGTHWPSCLKREGATA